MNQQVTQIHTYTHIHTHTHIHTSIGRLAKRMVIIPSGWASHSRKRERSFIGEPLRGSHILHTSSASRACARFALRAEKWFLAHFWAILEPRYGHLKAFLGPKMTKTRSKQPKITPNHPKNGQKWCRNSLKKSILGSFWGHFGVFWGLLGSF